VACLVVLGRGGRRGHGGSGAVAARRRTGSKRGAGLTKWRGREAKTTRSGDAAALVGTCLGGEGQGDGGASGHGRCLYHG